MSEHYMKKVPRKKGSTNLYRFPTRAGETTQSWNVSICWKHFFVRGWQGRSLCVCVYATDFAEWWIALVIPPSRKSLNEKWAGISLPLLPIGSLGSVIMKKTRKIYESLWDAPVLRFCSRPSSSAKRAFLTKGFKCSRVVKYFALITFRAPHKQ